MRRSSNLDNGQAAVELALALPLLCVLLLGAVQIVLVSCDQLIVMQAARVGARAAAVSGDPSAAGETAVRRAIGKSARVVTTIRDKYVTVTVTIVNVTDVALVGALMPDVELTGQATMLLEPP